MSDLTVWEHYCSHPDKLLREHMNGVMAKVERRTLSPVARAAALFHDLGKLNPNFQPKVQPKLDGAKVEGYSSHAYLGALSFLAYCLKNPELNGLKVRATDVFWSVLTIIAHHHGHLPDLRRALNSCELDRLEAFLSDAPVMPVSEFLSAWQPHEKFDLTAPALHTALRQSAGIGDRQLERIEDKIAFWLDTQFGFAALVEADKRDAGNNEFFKRDAELENARGHFSTRLQTRFETLQPRPGREALDALRSQVRALSCENLRAALDKGERVFSLTSPTGSGKTFALLALSDVIRRAKGDFSVIYGLPFLSITEQVEGVCRNEVWRSEPEFVSRMDSRARNERLEVLIAESESEPSRAADALREAFSQETFDAAFCVTTFVQIFETLLSNRNATLLKLPNFSQVIFLLDEVQALPPRLYAFFAAYLHEFCARFDCYAVFSTATMPVLSLPSRSNMPPEADARRLFSRYTPPTELLPFEQLYTEEVFDRYRIQRVSEPLSIETLAERVREQEESCLVILNTVEDSRRLFDALKDEGNVVLLNTRFTLNDRQSKLAHCKNKLQEKERVILISTQLIEAGVDIDFPVVFRDLCPLPNLIQSAGRCNRNGELQDFKGERRRGTVFFFELHNDKGRARAELVYRDAADRWILEFSRRELPGQVNERDLLQVQRRFWEEVNANLEVGRHPLYADGARRPDNLIRRISEAAFETVGSFRLIDECDFGEEFRYYVPQNDADDAWERLTSLLADWGRMTAKGRPSYADSKLWQLKLDTHLRTMSGHIVALRCRREDAPACVPRNNGELEACGLRKLANDFDYSFERGLGKSGESFAIL